LLNVHGIEQTNLVEMNDVPKIPTDHNIDLPYWCQGNVQQIVVELRRQYSCAWLALAKSTAASVVISNSACFLV
jgi:hypothetical protein